MINAPSNIPYFFNRASQNQLSRLTNTLNHFKIRDHKILISETLLRLDEHINNLKICHLPKDAQSIALFEMYKYYCK